MCNMIESDVKRVCNSTKEGLGVVPWGDYLVAWQHAQHGAFKTPEHVLVLV